MTYDYIQPFDLAPNFSESECQSFLSYCSEKGASDIVLQTNDYAWVEIKGRQRRATTRPLRDQEI
ncbi:hypothetical protein ABTE74_22520, partial [Acinetobacter baumannii]